MSQGQDIAIHGDLNGYFATSSGAGKPGVIVLMEAFGLKPHIRNVCDQLAAAGFAALAPDLLRGTQLNYEGDMARVRDLLRSLDDDAVLADIAASADCLARQPQVDRRRLGVIGFCVGGRFAFLANARLPGRFKGAVSIYGGGIAPTGRDPFDRTPPIVYAHQLQAPQLLIYGGRDPSITMDEHARIVQRLGMNGKRYTLSVYPDATHGFCCEERSSYHPQSARAALAETVEFLRHNLVA